jgi:uncharacterized protein (TIGR03086 family)
MDLNLPDMHRRALQSTRAIVAAIGDDQWQAPTPCDDWDVRALLDHIVTGNEWVPPLVGGQTIEEVGDRLDGDQLGADPAAAYEASAAAADGAFSSDGAMDAPCAVSYGPVPGSVYCGHRLVEVLVHGWDLAKATGQDTTLDPELVSACWEVLRPQLSLFQASGEYGTTTTVADGADDEAKLLAALGREA